MNVNIRHVNFPGPQSSGKYGSIVDHNGNKIMVPADMLGLFRQGTSVEIRTKEQTWFRGTPDEAVMTIATSGPQQGYTAAVQGQGGQAGYQRPAQSQAPSRSNTGFQPRVVEGGKDQWSPEATRWNFIMGITGRAMGSGKFTASEIRVLADEASLAFERLKGRPTPAPEPERTYTQPAPLPMEDGDPGPELQ